MKVKTKLLQAMEVRRVITCIYKKKFRCLEPHHLGILGGSEQLHCYQIAGESSMGYVPCWKNFKLSKIKNITICPHSPFTVRASYNPTNSHYSKIEKSILDTAT